MNKEKIIKGASEILGIAAYVTTNADDDKTLSECLEMVENENYGANLTDEQWVYGLVATYAFNSGLYDEWKEYQVKFNQALLGVAK